MFGIESYTPHFYSKTKDIILDLGQGLKDLIGKNILDIWAVYNTNNNEWFQDCPVVLNIEGLQFELCTTKIDELAITFNMIDMSQEINWYGIDDFKLEWRKEPFPELFFIKDKRICNIELIEYNLQTELIFSKDNPKSVGTKNSAWILNGIGFELENGYFSVYNGLDQNEIGIEPDLDSNLRVFKISNC